MEDQKYKIIFSYLAREAKLGYMRPWLKIKYTHTQLQLCTTYPEVWACDILVTREGPGGLTLIDWHLWNGWSVGGPPSHTSSSK